jgi:Peptidase of plants and bacteria
MPAIPAPKEPQIPAEKADSSSETTTTPPQSIPTPLTRLKINDLSSKGTKLFLQSVDATTVLQEATSTVLKLLNPSPHHTSTSYPAIRSITLLLHPFQGVAYTTSKTLDPLHKEIHFSTTYIESLSPSLLTSEITGVLVHEMVHVWQYNGHSTCNGGLIEGIADWVRLKAGFSPPHWRREAKDREWDAGYEVTGWFLEWLEEKTGNGTVPDMNQRLREGEYDEDTFWEGIFGKGKGVEVLWAEYGAWLAAQDKKDAKKDDKTEEVTKAEEPNKDEKVEEVKKEEKTQEPKETKTLPVRQRPTINFDDLPADTHYEDIC